MWYRNQPNLRQQQLSEGPYEPLSNNTNDTLQYAGAKNSKPDDVTTPLEAARSKHLKKYLAEGLEAQLEAPRLNEGTPYGVTKEDEMAENQQSPTQINTGLPMTARNIGKGHPYLGTPSQYTPMNMQWAA